MVREARSLREERHINKLLYLGASDLFYEPNYPHYRPSDDLVSMVVSMIEARAIPWKTQRADVWTHVVPYVDDAPVKLPKQGWKIHVSANDANCRDILAKIAALAFEQEIQFKFANDVNTLKLMTSKRWARGGSGKFITLYPAGEEKFHRFLECAYILLKEDVGSYILSDRRYKDSRCLYYRYGGFVLVSRMNYMGKKLPILTSPDGEEVVDERNPYFEMPHWVTDPFPADDADEGEMTLNDGRYLVTSALGFSNTGGVYLATDGATGSRVVIKEARPHVELGGNGQDATTRLAREERNLRILDGLGIAPRVHDTFWDWENFYLVEEYLDAYDMREVMLTRSPLLRVNPTLADSEAFFDDYRRMFGSLLDAIDRIHREGLVIGDLSPLNILVEKATLTVRIIDLEGAFMPATEQALDIHTPGFRPELKGRKKENGIEDDVYAVAAIMLYTMFPLAVMAHFRTDLFTTILSIIVADIGWSRTPVQQIIAGLANNTMSLRAARELLDAPASVETPMRQPTTASARLPEIRDEMARFLAHHYRLDALYTLFPIDTYGSSVCPASLGLGSTGIVYALSACGFEVPPPALERYRREIDAIKAPQIPPGFLVGAAGIAWALLATGESDAGKRFLAYANGSPLARAHHSLYHGMAGIGMANLAAYLMLDDRQYLRAAIDLAETLAATAVESERGIHWKDEVEIRIGFGYGQSGVALFFLRLSQVLDAPKWRALGRRAVEYDLSFAHELEPGVAIFPCAPDETNTYESYIEEGTAGIVKTAVRYGMWDKLDKLLPDLHRKYSSYPGLIYGVTGFIDVLLDAYLYSGDRKYLDMAERPLQGLSDLYLFETGTGNAIPGDNLFRVSCDFGTGVAGAMRTLHRFEHLQADEFCLDGLDKLPCGVPASGAR